MSDPSLNATGSVTGTPLPTGAAPTLPALALPAVRDARPDVAGKEQVIDAIRGFAALLVAYFHCRQVEWIGMQTFWRKVGFSLDPHALMAYLTLPVAWGSAGVPIFFVISGYCIHRGEAYRLVARADYRLDARNFWQRRFVRIYPVLLGALILTFALDWFSYRLPPVNHKLLDIGWQSFLINLFSLQGVLGKTYGSNGALWTLSVEVQFYLLYPLLFALRKRFGMPGILIGTAVISLASAWWLERREIEFFTSYWFAWTLGAWIADWRAQGRSLPRYLSAWLPWLALAFTLAGCVAFSFGQWAAFQFWSIGFACCFVRAIDPRGLPRAAHRIKPAARYLARVGDFSFSLYVVHLPVFVLMSSLMFRSAPQMSIWPSFVFMSVALPVAYGFYRVVELPAMRAAAKLKPRR